MIKTSPVSFGSTYVISTNNNDFDKVYNVGEIQDALKNELSYDKEIKLYSLDKFKEKQLHLNTKIVADDELDEKIESFLTQRKINFVKKTNEELFSQEDIIKRMRVPIEKYGYNRYKNELVFINTDKFDKLFKESFQYIGKYDDMEWKSKSRYDGFKEYIKTDLPIDASEVYINDSYGKPEICFQDGRHRYAVLRDMGFKKIPVAMNEESYKLAIKYGLVDFLTEQRYNKI